jgi:hypothetical protein
MERWREAGEVGLALLHIFQIEAKACLVLDLEIAIILYAV